MNKQKSYGYILTYILLVILIVLSTFLFSTLFNRLISDKERSTPTVNQNDKITYVIDAGHGGEDGGAIADDGTVEKELNLEISKALSLIFELNGNDVRMTRTTDTLLYDHYGDLNSYKGKKKIYDLKNRVRIAKEYESPVFISIHMNKFSDKKYSGLQVYYSKNNENSRLLAENVQKNCITYMQNDNKRAIKASTDSIYVLTNLSCPALLIECGFLSNDRELESLKSPDYQKSICLIIATSVLGGNVDKLS